MRQSNRISRKSGRFIPSFCLSFFLSQVLFLSLPGLAAGRPLASPYRVEGIEYNSGIPKITGITGIEIGLRHTTPY